MPAQRCRHRDGRTQLRQLKAGRTQSTAAAQQPWCSTPALAKRAQLRPARTLGKADVHCSDSAVRRTFCTNCEPFAAHPRVEKNTCAKRRHNL